MIRLSALALLFVSTTAFATPKVGDFAMFDTAISLNGQAVQGTVSVELMNFDAAQGYLQRQTVEFPGRAAEVTEEWMTEDNFLSDETIDMALANCPAAGGTAQTITVPAGTYNTCAIKFDNEQSSGIIWVGKVPFGIVRLDNLTKSNGMVMSSQLKTYR